MSLAVFSTRPGRLFSKPGQILSISRTGGDLTAFRHHPRDGFKPGGVWRFVLHGPDGRDYQNKVVYVEIVEPERLVYDHVSGPQFRMTVTFADQGGKTIITAQMLFDSAALRDKTVKEFGALEGLKQTIGRLSEYLTQMKGAPSNER